MASGRPDWYGSMSMHGKFGDVYKPVAVDTEGNLMAAMYGGPPGARHYIEVDAAGIMKANLALQDLDQMTVRVYYGAAKSFHTDTNCPADTVTSVKLIEGKGMIYSGYMGIIAEGAHGGDKPEVKIDGNSMGAMTWANYMLRGIIKPSMFPTYCTKYNDTDGTFTVALTPGMTFETSIELVYDNTHAIDAVTCYYGIGFAEIT